MTCWLCVLSLPLLLLPAAPPPAGGCPARCECTAQTRAVACTRRRLTAVPEGIPAETRLLELSRNRIRCLNPGDLAALPALEELDLSENAIAHVEPGAFANLPRLRVLRLRGNQLKLIPPGVFTRLDNLTLLDLSENKLVILLDYTFQDLHSLRRLEVGDNDLVFISRRAFAGLLALEELTLERCEIRAHLLPSKACRPRTPGSRSTDPQPLPPPLPKKILTRTQSLPNRRTPHASSIQVQLPRRPFLGSHSVDKSQAEVGPACPPAELTFGLTDAPLGLSLRNLHSPEAVHAALAARQLQGLHAIYARLRARFMGGHPGPCRPGHGFRLLDSSPCAESGDALYYRVVRVHDDAWHILVAKVPKPGADVPHPWGLELQASLSPHFNLQGLCGVVPEGTLPGAPWRERAAGGEAPSLEDWLCCEYLAEATESSMGQALALLWD
ncbi:PREDICTED: putative uncharacterized protein C19orf35 homolog [Mandrillus leucophaeus]|uniref:putative uncharacterized protein C19orf35 homolog n=1 Tax=Mandrillus leucophaeus TaxID=9568 RepID=UPI0005F44DF9|nr:PREDICTED: putative uncharacterized protein C19orf35 homolog [Mandrillus leucophaeus]